MGKNIVILIGSPRPKGSSAALARAFAEGARSAGHNVTEFFLGGMEIHGCKACRGGRSDRDFPCVQHDGMDEIYPAVRGCDVLVLASPLYYWNLSGPLMTAINRLFALEEGGENLLPRPRPRLGAANVGDGHDFGDVLGYYDHLLEHLKWQNLGHVLARRRPRRRPPGAEEARASARASPESKKRLPFVRGRRFFMSCPRPFPPFKPCLAATKVESVLAVGE